MRALHEKYKNDPDAVFDPNGIHFVGPQGRHETEEEHLHRLEHNARMRFNRSIQGQVLGKSYIYYIYIMDIDRDKTCI